MVSNSDGCPTCGMLDTSERFGAYCEYCVYEALQGAEEQLTTANATIEELRKRVAELEAEYEDFDATYTKLRERDALKAEVERLRHEVQVCRGQMHDMAMERDVLRQAAERREKNQKGESSES